MERETRTIYLAFTLETQALTLSKRLSLKGAKSSDSEEAAIGLVLGLSPNGTRRGMQKVADKLATKVGTANRFCCVCN